MNYSLVGERMANQMQGDGVVNPGFIDYKGISAGRNDNNRF